MGGGLEAFVFLGRGEARKVLAGGGALHADAKQGLLFGSGFAKDNHGAKGFCVHAGDQVGFAGVFLLPKLANLNFGDAHVVDADFRGACRGCQQVFGVPAT
jgi:hypothetical protein